MRHNYGYGYCGGSGHCVSQLAPAGRDGQDGAVGGVGPAGPQGIRGLPGLAGLQGDTGPVGPTGLQGARGDTGPAGPQGVPGTVGPTGPSGAVGPQGPRGQQGTPGANGPDGSPGPQGPTGPSGTVTGPEGPTGITGPEGPTGPGTEGPAGPTGLTGIYGDCICSNLPPENRRAIVAFNIPNCFRALGCRDARRSAGGSVRSGGILPCTGCLPEDFVQDVCQTADVCGDFLTSMGYNTTTWCGANEWEFMHNSVTDADVLVLACHGFAGRNGQYTAALGMYQSGLPLCGNDGDEDNPDDVGYMGDFALVNCDGSNNYSCSWWFGYGGAVYDVRDYVWNNCKLAVLYSCYSAGSPADANGPADDPYSNDTIGWSLFNQGIKCVIAWCDSEVSTDVKWVPRFLERCATGRTIADACNYATNAFFDYNLPELDAAQPIRRILIYGDATQRLTFNSVRSALIRMPAAYQPPVEYNMDPLNFTASETDTASIINFMKETVPKFDEAGFDESDFTMKIIPAGPDGGSVSAETGDFAVQFIRNSGSFVGTEGYSLVFRGNKAYCLFVTPNANAAVRSHPPPKVTQEAVEAAQNAALAKLLERVGGDINIERVEEYPFWDMQSGAYSISVNISYRTDDMQDDAEAAPRSPDSPDLPPRGGRASEAFQYYYPMGMTEKSYTGPSPAVTVGPEILSVCSKSQTYGDASEGV